MTWSSPSASASRTRCGAPEPGHDAAYYYINYTTTGEGRQGLQPRGRHDRGFQGLVCLSEGRLQGGAGLAQQLTPLLLLCLL